MSTPTLINLPPPPSDPVTPSDMGPGTPNSGMTSLSALSTTAIKDGHHGQAHSYSRHAHHSSSTSVPSTSMLDAERADRISRLAGLERVAAARASNPQNAAQATVATSLPHTPGYFDSYSQLKERSTVGSASATGSVGGRTTWASSSDAFDADKMSEDPDDGISSVGALSDEGNASLWGFGDGASSTISGPVSSNTAMSMSRMLPTTGRPASLGSPTSSRTNPASFHLQYAVGGQVGRLPPSSPSPSGSATPEPLHDDEQMADGITYDDDIIDTTIRTPRLVTLPSRLITDRDGIDIPGTGFQDSDCDQGPLNGT